MVRALRSQAQRGKARWAGSELRARARRGHLGLCGEHVELDDGGPLALCGLELGGTQDLDTGRLSPAKARHVLVCTVRARVRDRVEGGRTALLQLKPPLSQLPSLSVLAPALSCCQHWRIAASNYFRAHAQQAAAAPWRLQH